jgi:hypothetical protein
MTKQPLKLPERNVREYAHELAYKLAREQLAAITDIKEQCQKSGAQFPSGSKTLKILHLGRTYQVSLPDSEVTFADSTDAVPLRDKILVLHYFTHAKGTPLTGKMITYKELQEGINYYL